MCRCEGSPYFPLRLIELNRMVFTGSVDLILFTELPTGTLAEMATHLHYRVKEREQMDADEMNWLQQ